MEVYIYTTWDPKQSYTREIDQFGALVERKASRLPNRDQDYYIGSMKQLRLVEHDVDIYYNPKRERYTYVSQRKEDVVENYFRF